jgi:hypothetical protein
MDYKLYSHTTDGGATYLCTGHIDGSDEGDCTTTIIRMDGGPKFLSSLYAAAPDLLEVLKLAEQHLEYCGYGDSYERECARDEKLPQKIATAIAKATNGAV